MFLSITIPFALSLQRYELFLKWQNLFFDTHKCPDILIPLMLGNNVEQFSFLFVEAATQPVAHRAAGVAHHRARSAIANPIFPKDAVHWKLKGDTRHLAAVALHLELHVVAQLSFCLSCFLAAFIGMVAPLTFSGCQRITFMLSF